MNKFHKIRLQPNKTQETFFWKSCGTARKSYNWALEKWNEMYAAGERPSAYTLIKLQNSLKKTEWPWMSEVGKCAPQYAIHNLEKGFKMFFKKIANRPKFKKRGVRDSFVAVENSLSFKQKDFKIWIPRLGWVHCAENLRFEGKVNHVVVTRTANKWFASVNMEVEKPIEIPTVRENQAAVGIDMGISSMLTLSDGTVFHNPYALKRAMKRLKRLQRSMDRKIKGSNSRWKARMRVARQHYRIDCVRSNAVHAATTEIIRRYGRIIIEDLDAVAMRKDKRLARLLVDVPLGEIRRQLTYKALWQGKELVVADRWFASSKTCSHCGHKKEQLKLSERVFSCEKCGLRIDRDLNAARNLVNYSPTEKSSESYAGGASNSSPMVSRDAVKQEICLTF